MFKKIKVAKAGAVLLSAAFIGLFGITSYYDKVLPDSFYVETGQKLELNEFPAIKESTPLTVSAAWEQTYPETKEVSLSLFGIIPVKNVEVHNTEAPTLIAGGTPFGIKLLMDGVMVIHLDSIEEKGSPVCPAFDADIKEGDIIRLLDNKPVSSNSEIQNIINESDGKTIKATINRGGNEIETNLTPVYSESKKGYFAGMWVRDSTAGIGTITFIDKSSGRFAGLGHPICDADTGEIVPLSSGQAVPVEITCAVKGRTGIPGELQGCFTSNRPMGSLTLNNKCGVFGTLTESALSICCGNEYKMGFKQEIKEGKATVLTTVSGCQAMEYEIEIESVDCSSKDNTKNMTIRITDKRLLNETGGIVQGMSGSPIIQDNKLVGAVTHVFIEDSSRGYAIFAENMFDCLSS